jgi:hypothetical protein
VSDDTPTLRLPENLPPTALIPSPAPPGRPPRPSRAPLVAFIIVAVLVVAASGLLVYILISRGGVTPSAATTPPPLTTTSAPPSSPAPPPPSPGVFTSFAAPETQRCDSHGKGHQNTELQVSWSTTNATEVWIATGTEDAVSAGTEQVPLAGNQDSLPMPLDLDCRSRSTTFTLTLVGDDGGHVSKTWTVTNDRRG